MRQESTNTEQHYCVVATDKDTRERRAITSPMSYEEAEERRDSMNSDRHWKSYYRYFKVAKYPYKERMEGQI